VCPYSNRKKFEIRNISSKRILELLDEYSWLIMNTDNKDFIRECNRTDEIKQLVKKVFSNIGNKIELKI
jgi:GDP-D-mannose dehydratase